MMIVAFEYTRSGGYVYVEGPFQKLFKTLASFRRMFLYFSDEIAIRMGPNLVLKQFSVISIPAYLLTSPCTSLAVVRTFLF